MEETTVENSKTIISKGYEFLRQLCSFSADFNAFKPTTNPITNRVQYIMHQLDSHKIPYTVDKFQPIMGTPDAKDEDVALVNIVVEIEGVNKDLTTVYLAHHDVVNLGTKDKLAENCQDNTASIANLLDLCVRWSAEKPANNVVIAFVDAEEIVSPNICGAQRLCKNIADGKYGKVKYAINLELTANGQNYWMSYRFDSALSQHIKIVQPNTHRVGTPYNDSFVLERAKIPSVCVGSLNDGNLNQVKTSGYCRTWMMCHSLEDTFESQAVEADMDLFVSYLQSLV